MIYQTPVLNEDDQTVIIMIDELRRQLRYNTSNNPHRWTGFLRRNTFARAIRASNSIEGYHATVEDVVAAIEQDEPIDAPLETWQAVSGYRDAMTYALQLSKDSSFEYHAQLIKSLHFMMLKFDLQKMPGQYRPGDIYVVQEETGDTVYQGPDATKLNSLIGELVSYLNKEDEIPSLVKAAMAHLNLTMIHPFKDGNGRMARALQTLVLARDGIVSPTFSSIEEWLGKNTQKYYDILAKIGEGKWNPANSSSEWVKFCLTAHYQQAATLLRRITEIGRAFEAVELIIRSKKLHDRMEIALVDAIMGYKVRSNKYRKDADVSEVMASRDLKKLCDSGLLIPVGEKRGRHYLGSDELRGIRQIGRIRSKIEDPYEMVEASKQPDLPGI